MAYEQLEILFLLGAYLAAKAGRTHEADTLLLSLQRPSIPNPPDTSLEDFENGIKQLTLTYEGDTGGWSDREEV